MTQPWRARCPQPFAASPARPLARASARLCGKRTGRWTGTALQALGLLAAALLAVGCAGPGTQPAAPAAAATAPRPVTTLRVIAFNDFHGHLAADGLALTLADPRRPGATVRVPAGGAAALAGLASALRAGVPHSALVSSGDAVGAAPLVSALFRHESTIDVLNQIGLDVATVGNHEFDAGLAELQRLLGGGCAAAQPGEAGQSCALKPGYEGARFPVVAANVQGPGPMLFAPHWVHQYGAVKVGFIGAVTRDTPNIVSKAGVAGLRFEDEAVAINRSAAALTAQGVKAIVVLVHEGGVLARSSPAPDWNDRSCPGLSGDIVDIARRITPEVDLIFSAHSHQGYNCVVDGRPLLQAYSYGRGLSVVDLALDERSGDVDRARTVARNLPVLNALTDGALRAALVAAEPAPFAAALAAARPDPAIEQLVARYQAAAAPRANRPVGRIDAGFDRSGRTDSSAGRLVADAQWLATRAPEQGGAQLALMNTGGIRTDLPCRATPPCTVTYGEVFAMQPFGNSLVVMTLSGADLKALLEQQQGPGRDRPSFLQPSAGLSYRWVASAPAGARVQELRLQGQPVLASTPVRLTVNSFMADGGDGFSVLRRGTDRQGGPQDIDALMALVRTGVVPSPQARILWAD